ncbi:ArsR/SmtB family transcription factor [Streptomyces hirsutus]|uniref:ArsR/SmtB family transcription factor n=1 Tax=Streptomyces hirsutus TaxID=35620 RepID=UPI0036B4C52B
MSKRDAVPAGTGDSRHAGAQAHTVAEDVGERLEVPLGPVAAKGVGVRGGPQPAGRGEQLLCGRVHELAPIASHPGGEACVCDIADVGVSQPTASHHLKKLRETGLLTSERRGTRVSYQVAPSVVAAVAALLDLRD